MITNAISKILFIVVNFLVAIPNKNDTQQCPSLSSMWSYLVVTCPDEGVADPDLQL